MTSARGRATVDRGVRCPLAPAAAAGLGSALLVRRQVRTAHRRYAGVAEPPPAVDLVVPAPSAGDDGGPVRLVGLGDSGMAGVGVDDPTACLPALVAQRLARDLHRPVHVRGHGRSGARTADVLAEQLGQVSGPVDVAVLMVGTNDVTHLTPIRRLRPETEQLLDGLAGLGARVVVSGLPEFRAMRAVPWALRSAARSRAARVDRMQRAAVAVRPHATRVDVRAAVGSRFVVDPSTLSGDRFHPSARGYALIADAMAPAVLDAARGAPARATGT